MLLSVNAEIFIVSRARDFLFKSLENTFRIVTSFRFAVYLVSNCFFYEVLIKSWIKWKVNLG